MRFNYLIALSLLSSTAVLHAADPQRITPDDMPQQWQYDAAFDQTLPTEDGWWRTFHDSMLDSLISVGTDNNYNVLMAQRRIEIARQGLRQARSAYMPQFSLAGSWTKAQQSGMSGDVASKAVGVSYFDLGINMQWEIDIFGKITARARESKAQFSATKAEYQGAMVAMAAKIASSYFQLRTVQAEIAVMEQHIAMQDTVVKITNARHKAGLASMLDVTQSLTTYYSTLASLSQLKASETATINAISVLVGEFPGGIDAALRQAEALPEYKQIVAAGVPMQLLRRRPDIVSAEYQLAAYAAALGIAKKDFLPSISLSGSIGTQAHKGGDLFGKESLTYSIAPTLSWTIFDGLARRASVASAKQQMLMGIDNYNLTVITAVQEVESAMSAYTSDLEYIGYLQNVVQAAYKSYVLSVDLYKQGLTAFINVTTSQITLLQYSNELAVAQGQALSDLVSLYEALGGGFE